MEKEKGRPLVSEAIIKPLPNRGIEFFKTSCNVRNNMTVQNMTLFVRYHKKCVLTEIELIR